MALWIAAIAVTARAVAVNVTTAVMVRLGAVAIDVAAFMAAFTATFEQTFLPAGSGTTAAAASTATPTTTAATRALAALAALAAAERGALRDRRSGRDVRLGSSAIRFGDTTGRCNVARGRLGTHRRGCLLLRLRAMLRAPIAVAIPIVTARARPVAMTIAATSMLSIARTLLVAALSATLLAAFATTPAIAVPVAMRIRALSAIAARVTLAPFGASAALAARVVAVPMRAMLAARATSVAIPVATMATIAAFAAIASRVAAARRARRRFRCGDDGWLRIAYQPASESAQHPKLRSGRRRRLRNGLVHDDRRRSRRQNGRHRGDFLRRLVRLRRSRLDDRRLRRHEIALFPVLRQLGLIVTHPAQGEIRRLHVDVRHDDELGGALVLELPQPLALFVDEIGRDFYRHLRNDFRRTVLAELFADQAQHREGHRLGATNAAVANAARADDVARIGE
jgi:hypothetical protein